MANKHISEDEIKYIISAESSKAQQEIHALTKATRLLQKEEKIRKTAMVELEAQGKKNTKGYQNLEKECKEYSTKIKENKKLIEEQTKKLDVNALTMSQLKKRAKDLQTQLDNTSRAANPHEYAALEKQLGTVRGRMDALKTAGKNVEQSLGSIIRTNGAVATFLGNIYTRVSMFVMDTLHGMKEFSNEGIRMAASADGVSRAFDKLNQPNLLAELRKATKGTVNDLELMKATTMSDFFRIPLGDLAKYLQFAQIRAQQTGQSVEYMTNSIVTGLGRQSLKILDNLGLSAAEINEEVAKTGDFMKGVANIVDRELVKAGENYISAADKAAARTVELQNKQMELGKTLLPVKGQWASLTHTIKMGLSDVTIWLAKHSESIFTTIKVITGLIIITKAVSAAHAAWNALLIAGRTLTLLHAAAVANSTGNLIRYNAAMKLYNITAAQGSIVTKACTAGTLLFSAAKAALTGNIVKARIAMQAFSAVTKITPWGAAAAGIGLVVSAFIILSNKSNSTQKSIVELSTKLGIAKIRINDLFEQLKKTNPGTDERRGLLQKINNLYPGLLANYSLEKAGLEEISRAQDKVTIALTNRIATEMKGKAMDKIAEKSLEGQLFHANTIRDTFKEIYDAKTYKLIQKDIDDILQNTEKGTSDLEKYMNLFGNKFDETQKHRMKTSLGVIRIMQKEQASGIQQLNEAYAPYLESLKKTTGLTEEQKQQIMEQTSIIKKAEKEKEVVQNTWLEDTKKNIDLKNKELERLDAEIKKYKELGKVKADKSDPNSVALKNNDSSHADEINQIRLSGQQKQQTEEEINLAILTSDKTYYTQRITELEKFKATERKSSKQAEYQKQIVDSRTKLLNTEVALEKQSIATIEKLRANDLANESKTTKAYQLHYTKELANKKISKEQYEMLILSLDYSSAETRLAIEQRYLNDVNDLELNNGQLKSDAVKRANDAVLVADQSAANARAAQQTKLDDLVKDFKTQFKVTTVDEDHDAQKAVLEASYLARKKMAEKENMDTATLDAAYNRASEQLEADHQAKIQSVRDQYGISTQQERFNAELLQLKAARDQGLIVEEDYEKAVKNLKRDSYKQQFDYYSDLFAGAVNALQQAEMDNVDAKYDAEIEAAQGNAEEVERLENEKAQKKLDIEKKYADINFAIKASQIIADTAVSIMKAIADLGPIAGPIAAALMGVTGAAQLVSANAERQKVKNMTLSGSKSSAKGGTRVATGRESGGSIDVRRAQDGKLFPAADYNPDARGFIDRPTVIVGEGPSGQSKEWVASNAAVQNPTVAPILNLLDKAQQAGTIRTLDLNQAIRANMAGYSTGGSISQSPAPAQSPQGQPSNVSIPAPLMEKLANAIISIDENGVSAPVVLSELERKQELRNRSRNIGSKQ